MAVSNTVRGTQAIFQSGGILALSTALQDMSPLIAAKKQKLKAIVMTADATCTVLLAESGTPTNFQAAFGLLANTPLQLDENKLEGLVQTATGATGTSLQIKATTGTPNITFTGIVDLE